MNAIIEDWDFDLLRAYTKYVHGLSRGRTHPGALLR
jgi:hypothetical protein